MNVPLFSVRDKHAGFGYPTVDVNEAVAKRNFSAAINNAAPASGLAFAPGDFDLYHVGYFDTETGKVSQTGSGVPNLVISGASVFVEKE